MKKESWKRTEKHVPDVEMAYVQLGALHLAPRYAKMVRDPTPQGRHDDPLPTLGVGGW